MLGNVGAVGIGGVDEINPEFGQMLQQANALVAIRFRRQIWKQDSAVASFSSSSLSVNSWNVLSNLPVDGLMLW